MTFARPKIGELGKVLAILHYASKANEMKTEQLESQMASNAMGIAHLKTLV